MDKLDFNETTPWGHQQEDIDRAIPYSEFGYLGDAGTGKTLSLIKTLRYKYTFEGKLIPTLIVSPLITLENWFDEWMKFSRIKPKRVLVLTGPMKKRIEKVRKAMEFYGRDLILVTNYDAIGNARKEFYEFLYKEFQPEVLVCDESHRAKTHNSNVTKRLINIADRTKYRYIMTGTFTPNSPMDVWAQFRILDRGETFGRNFYRFQSKYFHDANYGMPKDKYFPNFVLNQGALEDINQLVMKKCSRHKREDCLDLPELIEKTVYFDMTKEQKDHYKEMKEELITFVNGDAVSAKMALVKSLRLQQIVAGHVKTEKEEIIHLKSNRPKMLKEILTDLGPDCKVIIWAVFHANYKEIRDVCDKLKLNYVEGHGLINEKEKFKNVKKFNSDPSINVMIGHPKSLGIGINLKAAGVSIRYTRDFSFEDQEQSDARNYRGGSVLYHDKILRYDLVCRDSIEEQIVAANERKELTQEQILKIFKELT